MNRPPASGGPPRVPASLVAAGALALAAAVAAFPVLGARLGAERAARAVEVVADLPAVEAAAAAEGKRLDTALGELKAAGVTGLGVSELTARRLVLAGEAGLYTGAALAGLAAGAEAVHPVLAAVLAGPDFSPSHAYLVLDRADLADQAGTALCRQFSPCRVHAGGDRWVVEVGAGLARVADAGLGFRPQDLASAVGHGFRVVLRPSARPETAAEFRGRLEAALRTARSGLMLGGTMQAGGGVGPVVFAGAAVPGAAVSGAAGKDAAAVDGLDATAAVLRDLDLRLGAPARPGGRGYVVQAGLVELVRTLEGRVVRVASAPAELLAVATAEDLAGWWLDAVRQRNARLIYVRPAGGAEPLQTTVAALDRLRARLDRSGWPRGPAEPVPPVMPNRWQRVALASGGLALALLLLARHTVMGAPGRPAAAAGVGAAAVAAVAVYGGLDLATGGPGLLRWVGLGGAVLVPVAAADLVLGRAARRASGAESAQPGRPWLLPALADGLLLGLALFAGAAWLAALTSDPALALEVRTVPGTGAAGTGGRWLATLLLAGAAAAAWVPARGERRARRPGAALADAGTRPVTVGEAVAAVLLLGAVALGWWSREWVAAVAVPAAEAWLGAAPRAAEAFLAYPAAILAGLVARRLPAWLPAIGVALAAGPAAVAGDLLAGTVPVAWVLRRSAAGLLVGLLVGLAVRAAWDRQARR